MCMSLIYVNKVRHLLIVNSMPGVTGASTAPTARMKPTASSKE